MVQFLVVIFTEFNARFSGLLIKSTTAEVKNAHSRSAVAILSAEIGCV